MALTNCFRREERLPLILLALVFLLGLFLRIGAVSGSAVVEPVRGDAGSYFFYAVNLQTEGVYSRARPRVFGGTDVKPDADVPPGYPLFVATFLDDRWRQMTMQGVHSSIGLVIWAQALLSSLLVLLVYGTGRRLAGAWVGLGAATLTALSPHLVNINVYLLTESLFTLVFWAAMLLLLRALPGPGARGPVITAGLAMGMAALVRPTVQYLPLLLLLVALVAARAERRRAGLYFGAFATVLLAWGLRNLQAIGAFSNGQAMVAAIQVGMYPDFMYNGDPASLGMPYRFDPVLGSDYSSLARTLAVLRERFLAAPGEYLRWYLVGKPLAFFGWDIIPIGTGDARLFVSGDIYAYRTPLTPYATQPLFILTYLLSRLLYFPVLALAGLATVLAWVPRCAGLWGESRRGVQLLALCLLYATGLHMVGFPLPRYAIPFQPLLYLLALSLVAGAWRWWRQRPAAKVEAGPAVL